MSSKQRKNGVLISYITLILNSIINILLTPFLIKAVGSSDYGVYQSVYAFASNLLVVDLGTGMMMTRFMSIYIMENDEKAKNNFAALGILISAFSAIIALIAGGIMYGTLDEIYSATFTSEQMPIAKTIFILMILNVAISLFDKAFIGTINAHEKFVISKSIILIKVIVKTILLIVMIITKGTIFHIALIDLLISIGIMSFLLFYVIVKLKIRPRIYYIDKNLITSSSTFMLALLFQNVVSQINASVDKILIGSMISAVAVTIYHVGLIIVNANNQIANAIAGIYLPEVTKKVHANKPISEITHLAIEPGRLNLMLGALILVEFILFGKDFLQIWVGTGYDEAYWVAVFLLIAYLMPHIELVIGNILDAKNKRLTRSIVYFFIALINVMGTILVIPKFGILGAAFMTMVAMILGHWIFINIYYKKYIGVDVVYLLKNIFRGITPCIVATYILSLPLNILNISVFNFIIKCFASTMIFGTFMLKFGINISEKNMIKKIKTKLFKHGR